MKKQFLSTALAVTAALSLLVTGCGTTQTPETTPETETIADAETTADDTSSEAEETAGEASEGTAYTVGICNYVDDASLNQIVENIQTRLQEIGEEKGVSFNVSYDNCNADANVMSQIIANFEADQVDLMVGIATPVAMTMQAATEKSQTPVVFAAVSDPVACGVVDSLEAPGANVTGTSDYLNTNAIMDIIFAVNPEADKIGLLYDAGQDSSTTAIADAKAYLDAKNIAYVEHTGTNVSEVMLAADAMVADGVDAVFTPSDNTIMTAETAICETFTDAGIPHYAGADSFAWDGAFLGYGVDYANLGRETAEMIAEILLDGKNPSEVPVRTFDNGIATINTAAGSLMGMDLEKVKEAVAPFCTTVQEMASEE